MRPARWRIAVASLGAAALAAAAVPAMGDGMVPEDAAPAEPAPRTQTKPQARPQTKAKPRPAPPTVESSPATAPLPDVVALPPPPEPRRQLAQDETVPILGRKVVGANNEELGRVVNVLVDGTGRARAAVIDFGGFLGVGSRKIAVDWGQLVFKPGVADRQIGLTLTREQIQGAAEFKENVSRPVEVLVPPRDAPAATAKPPQ